MGESMYHIIVNPASRSGRGIKVWNEIELELKRRSISYKEYFTKGIGDASRIVVELTKKIVEEYIAIIVLGGDGTMNEVVQGIQDFQKTRVSYIPTGSSNDLARDLKIHHNPIEAISCIIDRPRHIKMDVGILKYKPSGICYGECDEDELITRRFCVSSGIGFDAAVCQEALISKIKNVFNRIGLGKLTYLGIALKQLVTAPSISCKLYLDDNEAIYLEQFLFITSMIHPYEGGGFLFCPKADNNDGLLDLCVVGKMSKLKMVCVLPTAFFGKHLGFEGVNGYRAKKIEIHTSAPLWLHTDGEVPGQTKDIMLTSIEEKLNFYY